MLLTLAQSMPAADPAAAAYRTTEDARDVLVARGVDPGRIHIVSYDAGGDAQAPIVLGYSAYARPARLATAIGAVRSGTT